MIYVGVDPGNTGAIVALSGDDVVFQCVMPTLNIGSKKKANNVYNVAELVALFQVLKKEGPGPVVAIEQQQAMPKQGVSSTFKLGRGFGQLEGIVAALCLPYELVRAGQWQKDVLNGVQGEGKQRAVMYVQRRLSCLDLYPGKKRKPHDGLADAACIALWMQAKRPQQETPSDQSQQPSLFRSGHLRQGRGSAS